MKNNKISIALTGHTRERLKGRDAEVRIWIKNKLKPFFEKYENVYLICGGADGADTIFGNMIFDPDFREESTLGLYLPAFDYRKNELENLYNVAYLRVALTDDEWNEKKHFDLYYERDMIMIDECDVLLAVWDGTPTGGTYNAIQYALKKNKPIIYIDENIFKD